MLPIAAFNDCSDGTSTNAILFSNSSFRNGMASIFKKATYLKDLLSSENSPPCVFPSCNFFRVLASVVLVASRVVFGMLTTTVLVSVKTNLWPQVPGVVRATSQPFWMKPRAGTVSASQSFRLRSGAMSFPFRLALFSHHVVNVVLTSAQKQMGRIAALRIIASMADIEITRLHACRQIVGNAMSEQVAAFIVSAYIVSAILISTVKRALPYPALIGLALFNLTMETFDVFRCEVQALKTYGILHVRSISFQDWLIVTPWDASNIAGANFMQL